MCLPASSIRANIFWYSLRCFFSSFGSLGGNQDGRVRERYFSFSREGRKGSISGSLLRMGGSGTLFFFFDSDSPTDDERDRGCWRLISC